MFRGLGGIPGTAGDVGVESGSTPHRNTCRQAADPCGRWYNQGYLLYQRLDEERPGYRTAAGKGPSSRRYTGGTNLDRAAEMRMEKARQHHILWW